MYNFMDTWAMAFTNEGRPLVGKIEFCEANTTELKSIFTTDGAELMNPIYCNGITSYQVMLDNGDYTVRYYEYIGNGNMESDFNEASWRLYKTELVSAPKANSTAGTDGVSATVSTIADLKAIDNMEDGTVVGVVGYYTAEDCPLRYYVWHENGNYNDDGGIIIKSDTTTSGAWVLKIPSSYIDVRWYGDIPSNSSLSSVNTSSLGQRTKAATAANKYAKDLYFPSYNKGTSVGFYMFDGSNTVSVNKDIIVDNAVRFVVKHGTSGTQVTCHELKACERYLFVSELGSSIGGYNITADVIDTSWYSSDRAVATGARVKYVIDYLQSPMTFNDTYVELANDVTQAVTFNNCTLEGFKRLSGNVIMSNMMVKTEWFKDDYDYSKLSLYNCQIELENCKDANTYILLKTKQNDPNYGDLGEQSINASVLPGGTIENCFGTITLASHGNWEFHNVSLTVNNLNATDSINAVDSWLTINSDSTLNGLQLRRGSLNGTGSFTLIAQSLIENSSISIPINTTGVKLTVRNSDIYAKITTRNIDLIQNQIYAEIDQSDWGGVITVYLSNNMFHGNGVHYVHADTVGSVVNGIWISNGSTYSDKHWIRLDRTNLKFQDIDHHYSYIANAEPYLDQWNGRNRPMSFKMYSGHWTSSQKGTGIFATTTIPFLFLNNRDLTIYAVPRQNFWRMFTVGRGFLCRSGCIKAACNAGEIGIMEGQYNDHKNGNVAPVFNWGCGTYNVQQVEMADGTYVAFEDYPDSTKVGCIQCVSRDGDGIAEYKCSFEAENATHGEFSYGMPVGFFPSTNWNGAGGGQGGDASYGGSLYDKWVVYPATSYQIIIYVFVDKDFSTGSNPQNVFN